MAKSMPISERRMDGLGRIGVIGYLHILHCESLNPTMQISLPLLLYDELERLLFHPATAATAFDAALSLCRSRSYSKSFLAKKATVCELPLLSVS